LMDSNYHESVYYNYYCSVHERCKRYMTLANITLPFPLPRAHRIQLGKPARYSGKPELFLGLNVVSGL